MQQNKTWILLRGLVHEKEHWGDFYRQMQKGYPQDRLICVDMLGAGIHHKESAPCSLPQILLKVRTDALAQAAPPFHLLGLSMGGMLAYEWACKFPHEIAGMVLLNPSFRNFSPFYKRLMWQSYPQYLWTFLASDPIEKEMRFLKIISNDSKKHAKTAITRAIIAKKRPVSIANALRQTLAAAKYAAQREPPKPKTLILTSKGDRLCAPSCSDAIRESWHVPQSIHPWAGHDLTLDDPDWVLAQLEKWLHI